MTATAAQAAFIKEEFRIVKNGPDSTVVAKYGDLARKTDVVPTFFETQADAQSMCDERAALLSPDSRRMTQVVSGEDTGLALAYTSTLPGAIVIDDRRLAHHFALVSEFTIDFGKQATTLETWGWQQVPILSFDATTQTWDTDTFTWDQV